MARTYAEAGVDIDASDRATAALVAQLKSSPREGDGAPLKLENGFAGLVQLGDGALAVCTDGVGTKLLLAQELGSLDTVGIDCVAMNVNDLICVGAEPLSFVDYVALEEPDAELMAQLGLGLAEGCRQANCTLSGGETAVVPELVRGFDLAGTAVGWVSREVIIDGSRVAVGDALIGLASSGPHSNGYTLIRRLFDGDSALGAQLVAPTRIYVRSVLALLAAVEVHALAHVTGGGLENLPRMNPGFRYVVDNPLPVPPVFDWLQRKGDIAPAEMYRTFNMGLGMVVTVAKGDVERTLALLVREGETAQLIGHVAAGEGVAHTALD
ncbi:MAG: phosphoribosylformylglycinamidine cyclo-ligase [Marine Group III euryarchaeote CG-Bathy2]|uniref:Phosphoribosylformylglycinamidine cyclo-ligase n=5 Tax=Methanobacteriati TaxID=3366610 RepID=A0A075H8F7_9EURY|nr:phosphoribosylformylglycinamidine cyclo-ligase (purM) [uncultured marine group II/III euryarchaeote KM3_156_D02]AIF08890.1 phosphoribosylformylglycinamidine cyclo-ligase (purM) [uncultured marine group II/III euryarchaeote KM3_33_C12]AIF10128.1 phosphoribosylformylglycinamidine cyclo-ligase (purM) [uncultured marine group II/III euryarchaeote KM3_43_F08]AIF11907.1 phosphoribosylaminoimidazole synthetase (purM) [uncultured marine group II/III euryarchaeote KM3_54_A09]OIR09866.1 MAG: phosphori